MIIPSVVIGALASLFTQILKIVPFFGKTDLRKKVLAFTIALLGVLAYFIINPALVTAQGIDGIIEFALLTLTVSYGTFETIIKPITSGVDTIVAKISKAISKGKEAKG
jgi:hypothetical protein